jgi:hypothetical protein
MYHEHAGRAGYHGTTRGGQENQPGVNFMVPAPPLGEATKHFETFDMVEEESER